MLLLGIHINNIIHIYFSRASGHRFRVNDINCHPVLPLLLTTSHHNVVHKTSDVTATDVSQIFFSYFFFKFMKLCQRQLMKS